MFEAIFSLNTLWWVCTVLWFPSCLMLVVVVLAQKGKGAGFAGAFGVGAGSETVFGPRARKSLPVRLTYIAAGLFMVLSLMLSLIVGRINAGAKPAEVDENAVTTATNSAMDSLFGDKAAGTEVGNPAAPVTEGADAPAPASTPEAPATSETKPSDAAPAAESAATPAPAPVESVPAPEATATEAPATQGAAGAAESTPAPGAK